MDRRTYFCIAQELLDPGLQLAASVYRTLSELRKAMKTIIYAATPFDELRREIDEGRNVIESWNSANDFIFFGNGGGGEMASNWADNQEISMLSLHLVQVLLVYVSTLMIQQVPAEPAWQNRLSAKDRKGLAPLLYRARQPLWQLPA